ncbi:hypothetical protein D3C87_1695000 [compost metagenome]
MRYGIGLVIGLEDGFQVVQIGPRHVGHGGAHGIAFQRDTDVEQFADLVHVHADDNRAPVQVIRHQAFGFQLAQRFAHGNAAGLEARGQGVLLERGARGQGARQDFVTQLVADAVRQRLGFTGRALRFGHAHNYRVSLGEGRRPAASVDEGCSNSGLPS